MEAGSHEYVIALGSNMRVPRVGGPRRVLATAIDVMAGEDVGVLAVSRIRSSLPLGPSHRRYANAAARVETPLTPPLFLDLLQDIETRFGRQRRGARWRSRPLDLDIILWSGGAWLSCELTIPHPLFRSRDFVTRPAREVAPHWRDPVTGLTLRQIAARAP
ncbi:2-amino-4-hydroxy-6-hydroxymethyldihydropteridine diphosphokinase [Qipengyuania sp. 1NDH17]|uniref:2-amino-4-hydroxy-6-hydroxymethyldihydropteridine pyrophosphokinase n=1 Tax=Qipengyuania polymorpha TaxID=2867234 RepID=A0ABS7IXN3_9SPHN|nr:2-amino-4-hydroxy-6-hydroxymethyldihydropteridine diphosphokinase [Qipengyuania polymorpha]MBX7458328.1 2-amino-4-hydroxy-6-hydroxymethyldihydropteridine diphosphokinase [Qipengyuania polymorpha]